MCDNYCTFAAAKGPQIARPLRKKYEKKNKTLFRSAGKGFAVSMVD